MKIVKKIAITITAVLCSTLIILTAAILVSPWLLDKTKIKSKVSSEVSRLISGEFSYGKTSLSLLPSPHVVLVKAQIDIPDTLSASVDTVEVYPELTKLFTGRFILKETKINRPKVTLKTSKSTADSGKHISTVELNRSMTKLLSSLSRVPKLVFAFNNASISQGSVSIVYNQTTAIKLENIDAVMENRSDALTVKVTSRSNMFDNLVVTGMLHTGQSDGNAHIELTKLKLEAVSDGFFPGTPVKILNGEADIGVDISLRDNKTIDLTLKGSAPNVRLEQAKRNVELEIQTIDARININRDSTTITLSDLSFGNPSMQVSGSFSLTDQSPKFDLQLQGNISDIKPIRSVSNTLVGSNSFTQTIFNIVKDGSISQLSVSSKSDTLSGLADFDNLVLQTSLANGTIDVPGTRLELIDVSGDVNISKGVLTAEHVLAQNHKSTVKNGRVKIDLSKDPLPLDIAADLEIDVAEIPAILGDVTRDHTLNAELQKIEDLKGSAAVALSLTGATNQLKIGVSANDIQLAGRYTPIPFLLKIENGGLTYDGTRITWKQLNGSLGSSTIASFSGSFGLGETRDFEITSGSSDILLSELLPWIALQQKRPEITTYYGGGKSTLHLSQMKAGGPLDDFHNWHLNITGVLKDLIINNLPKSPGPVKIESLHFRVDPQTINYSAGRLSLLDTMLAVSGTHNQYMKGIETDLHLGFDGTVGEETVKWFSKSFNIPSWLKLQPLTLTRSELTYSNHSGHNLTATLGLQKELKIFAKVHMNSNEVIIEKLKIDDHLTQATLGGKYKEPMLTIFYDGKLHGSTLNRIFKYGKNSATSMVDGKARVHLNLKNSQEVGLDGKLNGKNFSIPTGFGTPLIVKEISIIGTPETIFLKSSDLSWNDIALNVSGSISPNFPGKPMINFDVDTDSIDVEKILASINHRQKDQDKKPAKTFSMPVSGTVHFKANNLEIKKFTFQPLQAVIQIQDEEATITIKNTGLCAVMTSGTINYSPDGIQFDLKPEAQGKQLKATLDCFSNHPFKADGTFELSGHLEGHGTLDKLLKSTSGSLELSISDGRIYHDIVLLNVLKFLNTAQVLTGRISSGQMLEKGIGFDKFGSKVKLLGGKMTYEQFIFDGDEIKLSGTGEFDLFNKQVEFTLLVITQKTASTLLGYVPLVGGILQTFATIPLTVKGTIDDLHVLPLAPSAVGLELKEATKQALDIPLNLVHLHDFHKIERPDWR